MKKEYINPTVEIINIETAQMIAQSIGIGEPLESADGAESRDEFDLWGLIEGGK